MDDRRDDWRNSVDEHLVSLTTAQKVTDRQLDDLELKYEAFDKVIRGDAESDRDGFVSRLHNAENAIQELRAEFLKLEISDIEVKGFKWKFATEVIVKILTLIGVLFLGWDKLASLYTKITNETPTPLEQRIQNAKHPKGKVLYRTRKVQHTDLDPSEDSPLSQE